MPCTLPFDQIAGELDKNSARIYNNTSPFVRKIRKKDFWLSQNAVRKYISRWAPDVPMRTHSKQVTVQQCFNALKRRFAAKRSNGGVKSPFRTKKLAPPICKVSTIHFKGTDLMLSSGRDIEPFVFHYLGHLLGMCVKGTHFSNMPCELVRISFLAGNRKLIKCFLTEFL